MPQEPWHPEKGAKPDCIIQLDCGEVGTHASCKTTWILENLTTEEQKLFSFQTNYN